MLELSKALKIKDNHTSQLRLINCYLTIPFIMPGLQGTMKLSVYYSVTKETNQEIKGNNYNNTKFLFLIVKILRQDWKSKQWLRSRFPECLKAEKVFLQNTGQVWIMSSSRDAWHNATLAIFTTRKSVGWSSKYFSHWLPSLECKDGSDTR